MKSEGEAKAPAQHLTDSSEYDRFKAGLRQVLSVPKEELQRREAEYQRQQAEKKNGKAKAGD